MTDFGADAWMQANVALSGGLGYSGYVAAIILFALQDHFYRTPPLGRQLPPLPVCAAFYTATFITIALVLMSANLPANFSTSSSDPADTAPRLIVAHDFFQRIVTIFPKLMYITNR